ncbi:hypothetical protein QM467_00635 [Rhodoblastus sp. 17X3]|uniref:hypothetical protein n=1 Tax=Rhodoblastus sp. 17X3 TaxID=3047026 RepID=UPI0024B6499F|nr:hypothetical protein [Rhodoblastus sp. 17X3]MDI9846557.1 hypothetical protein [Rhodoblastus sp. 17X3]
MQLTTRLLPPPNIQQQSVVANGRTYSAAPGSYVDVPDFDAAVLMANGWANVAPSGPTSARPKPGALTPPYTAAPGFEFIDTTLNKWIVFDGLVWRDPLTGSAV